MSNHPSNTIKSRLLRRGLAGILSLALLLSLIPSTVLTARAAGWEDQYIQTLVDWGVMRGDVGGNMAPKRSITRAEFVTMMNRAYGYEQLGGHPFTDVRNRDWYAQDIDIAYNIGYFKGTSPTTASPNDTLTREQAAVLLSRNMMLQETVGETLGFSDSRTLSDWSRGLIGAAAANGIISGYEDGSFKPFNNITRGEVAAMLVRAIGTPIQEAGDHALGNVYGNVTVNTAGVKLRDGVIAGNLYLTGGIDLGDVLLENVTVLGQIIISGGGESNSSESSVILRNVTADSMLVDSIGKQFVTIRAEGVTDIPTTTVRTNAYVDDSSLPGYGLSFIELDGEEGALYQLAGNIKDVTNRTPGSDMQIVQGVADKVTVDEKAKGSSVLVDGDAQVGDLNLDTGTKVTGSGDIKNLNVGSAGSSVEQLPDNIVIRPGIDADVGGSNMDSTQAAQASTDPKLLAGYPAVRKIAPQSAELVFRTNKPGTIYWAVSAVADGSVSEADLLEPPVYGNRIVASGKITATAANTDYTAAVSRLTSGGSYYVTAMLVDGREEHSPIKVTSFTTPDNSVPAFADGYPVMTLVSTEIAQATVMTTKSCLLYYALLPKGAKAPTEAEFKSAAIPGNLGYGSQSVTKNVTIPINVNNVALEEKTDYVVYFWLVDHDGAQKSRVTSLPFTTPDETPPVVTYAKQLFSNNTPTANSIQVEYTIDEQPADFVWAIVTEGDHMRKNFLPWTDKVDEPGDSDRFTLEFEDEAALLAAKVQLASGAGALLSGSSSRSPVTISSPSLLFQNAKTSSFVLYYMADDNATNTGNLSAQIKALRVRTKDETPPDVSLRFNSDGADVDKDPQADADVRILFTEQVKGTNTKDRHIFLDLYDKVEAAQKEVDKKVEDSAPQDEITRAEQAVNGLKDDMAKVLDTYIEFHQAAFPATKKLTPLTGTDLENPPTTGSWINWRNAQITMPDDGSGNLEILLPGVKGSTAAARAAAGIQLEGGATYYFRFRDIFDLAYPTGNALVQKQNDPCYREFRTSFAKVNLEEGEAATESTHAVTDPTKPLEYIDFNFRMLPIDVEQADPSKRWDMLVWADTNMEFEIFSRPISDATSRTPLGTGAWTYEGSATITGVDDEEGGYGFLSFTRDIDKDNKNLGAQDPIFPFVKNMLRTSWTDTGTTVPAWEFAVQLKKVDQMGSLSDSRPNWSGTFHMRISLVSGTQNELNNLSRTYINFLSSYDAACAGNVSPMGIPERWFTMEKVISATNPPAISGNYPQIEAKSTTAKISLMLEDTGRVHYLWFPLNIPKNIVDNETTRLSESLLLSDVGTNYTSAVAVQETANTTLPMQEIPLMGGDINIITTPVNAGGPVSKLTATTVVSPASTQVYSGSVPGATRGVAPATGVQQGRTLITIDLKGLTPNTTYAICLVPQGNSRDSYAEKALVYRFTTDEPSRPTINAAVGGGGTVNLELSSRDEYDSAYVQYYLAQSGKEGRQLQDAFEGHVDANYLSDWHTYNTYGAAVGSKKYNFSFDYKDSADIPGASGSDTQKKMRVIDAMAIACFEGSVYKGSVFDVFASQNAKNTFGTLLTGAGPDERVLLDDPSAIGSKTITKTGNNQPANRVSFNIKDPNVIYTFVSVGQVQGGSGYAFRAAYPVQGSMSGNPMIDTKNITQYKWQNNDPTTGVIAEATISIGFTRPLYALVGSGGITQNIYPVDDCPVNATHLLNSGNSYVNLISQVSGGQGTTTKGLVLKTGTRAQTPEGHKDLLPIDTITLTAYNIAYADGTSNTITFSGTLCDQWRNGSGRRLQITVYVDRENIGTADQPVYQYVPKVSVSPNWDGTVTTP